MMDRDILLRIVCIGARTVNVKSQVMVRKRGQREGLNICDSND